MAKTNTMPTMAVVEFSGAYALPVADAARLLELLAQCNKVDYDWDNKMYKRSTSDYNGMASMKILAAHQVAALQMGD